MEFPFPNMQQVFCLINDAQAEKWTIDVFYTKVINTVFFLDLQLSLTAGEEVDIEYEVDGWFYVSIQSE